MIQTLRDFSFEEEAGKARVRMEPIGVVAMITPWNWPINQIAAKVVPALAAGCTMILKPSEESPGNAAIFAEVLHAAGVPAGVFNLVQGDGPTVGQALSEHPDVDMVSFTGSTRAGVLVAKAAAETVKRVHQELGGKSPSIVMPGADLDQAVKQTATRLLVNSGQSCVAPSRLLVPADKMDRAADVAGKLYAETRIGAPGEAGPHLGPVVNKAQWEKIQGLIEKGMSEGARLVTGGPGRPEGFNKGYYVRPTVFADVTNDMTIAQEEIFGPVIAILGYEDEEDAIRIANDTPYGLAAYAFGTEEEMERIAPRLRAGMVYMNNATMDRAAPFGGYKRSGNGREGGRYGLEDFLEKKALLGR
jgi:aldehyde dehydrogenase (NAD+)